MEMEHSFGRTKVKNMMEIIFKGRNMGLENLSSVRGIYMKDNGKMEKWMDLELYIILINKFSNKEFGKMVNLLVQVKDTLKIHIIIEY